MTIPTCFVHTLWWFYAFSGTNLLTRCRSASSCFLLFLVSEILVRKYSRNWTKSKPRGLFSHEASRSPKERRRGATEGPHPRAAWPPPLAARPCGVGPPCRLLTCPFAYKKSPWRKPQYREPRYGKPSRDAAAADPISGDPGDRLRHPAGEGNHLPEDSTPPWSPPVWCVSSLPLDYGSIAVARWLSSPHCAIIVGSCELPNMIKIIYL